MPYNVLEMSVQREQGQAWGFKMVGGRDVGKVVRVSKVIVGNTPAFESGLKTGDVLLSVQGKVVNNMTHKEVVNIIKGVKENELKLKIERGDHIIPNIGESFPIEAVEEMKRVID